MQRRTHTGTHKRERESREGRAKRAEHWTKVEAREAPTETDRDTNTHAHTHPERGGKDQPGDGLHVPFFLLMHLGD